MKYVLALTAAVVACGGCGGDKGGDTRPPPAPRTALAVDAGVAVDGVRLGATPVVWDGDGGVPHEFTFVLAGHTLARYRFVPVTNGVVHGRLLKITTDGVTPDIPAPVAPVAPPTELGATLDAAP